MQQILLGVAFASVLWLGAFGISFAVVEWRADDEPTLVASVDTRAERCASSIDWWDEVRGLAEVDVYEDTVQAAWDTMNSVCHELAD